MYKTRYCGNCSQYHPCNSEDSDDKMEDFMWNYCLREHEYVNIFKHNCPFWQTATPEQMEYRKKKWSKWINENFMELISHETIERFLKNHGWEKYKDYPNNEGAIWTKGDYHVRVLYDTTYADYHDSVQRLIDTLSECENLRKTYIIGKIQGLEYY